MTFPALQQTASRAALFAALRQDQLQTANDALGSWRWDVNMSAQTITFSAVGDSSRAVTMPARLIASLAPGPRSLLWGWAHPQGDSAGIATKIREYGQTQGVAELASAEVAFPTEADIDPEDWITQAAHQIAGVAVEATGASPYYITPLDGGARAVFLLEAALPALTVTETIVVLPRILAETPLTDPRTSVWGLARLAGWTLEWTDAAYTGARITDGTSSARFSFDEAGRITGFHAEI